MTTAAPTGRTPKVLTLDQPHATLVTLGVQLVVTMDEPTAHRGLVGIAASDTEPGHRRMGDWLTYFGGSGRWTIDRDVTRQRAFLLLGRIVGAAELVDVVPVLTSGQDPDPGGSGWVRQIAPPYAGALWHWIGPSDTDNPSTGRPTWRTRSIEDQRPYLDLSKPWAWLLRDAKPRRNGARPGASTTRTWRGSSSPSRMS